MPTSIMNTAILFQSGQHVPFNQYYEIVGATDFLGKQRVHAFLTRDDRFPDYEGRAVCWRVAFVEDEYLDRDQRVSSNLNHVDNRV